MRYILAIASILCSQLLYAQLQVNVDWAGHRATETKDTIYYSPGNKLEWNDFKGRPENDNIALAITSSGFGFTAGIQAKNGKGALSIHVYCYFSKDRSWVKEGKGSDYALDHEQHHFDISYIATCRFIQKLRSANFTLSNYNNLLNRLYTESTADLEALQNEYDGNTKNGRLKEVQAQWNNKINVLLAETAIIN